MDSQRWQLIRTLFDQAADLDPTARAAFLDQACADDASGLRQDIEALIAADEAAVQTVMVANAAPDLLQALNDETNEHQNSALVGCRLGAWRLIREIGRGGMGAVFLAERDDQEYVQQAAIKLIRPGWDAGELAQRFRTERQILATLNHANIARLLDGGVTDDGKPYLVLEYVAGEVIGQYCDHQRLDIAQRLALFLVVCDAVAYAHRNLIVHRDLKPSNILVDGDGNVKLLDFGIAKLLQTDTSATVSMARMFTPEYAAPEQLRGDPITTSVDVYALGMLLFELLTGRRPYNVSGSTPTAYEQAVLLQEPQRPSRAATVNAAEAKELARARKLDPADLASRLRGDLDAIVLKALRKNPAQRYSSIEDLANDVRRYLGRKPVSARRGNLRYRAIRFLQRHALATGLAAAAAISLVGGLGLALWQAHVATQERDRARTALETAERVTVFLTDMLSQTTPDAEKGRGELTVREVMDRSAENIGEDLADRPAVQARIQHLLGNVYTVLGDYPKAERLIRAALSTNRALFGERSEEAADSLDTLYNVMRLQNDYEQATQLAQQAHDIYAELFGEQGEKTLWMVSDLGVLDYEQGRYDEAAERFRTALDGMRRLPDANIRAIANTIGNQAAALTRAERYEEAELAHQESLDIRRRLFTEPHSNIAYGLHQLGLTSEARLDFDRAEAYYRQAREQYAKLYGEDGSQTVNEDMQIARLSLARGRNEEAIALLEQLLQQQAELFGAENETSAYGSFLLAEAFRRTGEPLKAKELIQPAVAVLEKQYPSGHPVLADALQVQSDILVDTGEIAAGCAIAERIDAMLKRSYPATHSRVLQSEGSLAYCRIRNGPDVDAEQVLRARVETLHALNRGRDQRTRQLETRLAELGRDRGRFVHDQETAR